MKKYIIISIMIIIIVTATGSIICMHNQNANVESLPECPAYSSTIYAEDILSIVRNKLSVTKNELKLVSESDDWYDRYANEKGQIYLFDKKEDRLIGFIDYDSYKGRIQTHQLSEVQMKHLADTVASMFVNIVEYDDQSYFFQEDTGVHMYLYIHTIKGYKSSKIGYVYITPSGTVQMVSFINDTKFDKPIPEFDLDVLKMKLQTYVTKNAPNVTTYQVKDMTIDIDDDTWIMEFSCECNYIDGRVSLEKFNISI